MEKPVKIFRVKQEITDTEMSILPTLQEDDLCFFRFLGGNVNETDKLIEQLTLIKQQKSFLFGIFRFPFRFEGKKRLHTAILQYHRMKEVCDGITYFQSDGMMDTLEEGTSIHKANEIFDTYEEGPIDAIQEMIELPGAMNIDVQDIRSFIQGNKGPVFIRSFHGDSFDEPLKYMISAPYLPPDYADGEQMMIHIGYAHSVDMSAFQHINLRLNDLFHKADLFKLGTYLMDEPGQRIKVTLAVNGISDPYPRPDKLKKTPLQKYWLKRKWVELAKKSSPSTWLSPIKR